MGYLLDTNIAIGLREGIPETVHRVESLDSKPMLSAITRVELEGGVYASPDESVRRRAGVDALLHMLPVLDFDYVMSAEYGAIVAQIGFSRRKVLDRMIAATAIVSNLTLITTNGEDFADIPNLKLEIWDL